MVILSNHKSNNPYFTELPHVHMLTSSTMHEAKKRVSEMKLDGVSRALKSFAVAPQQSTNCSCADGKQDTDKRGHMSLWG